MGTRRPQIGYFQTSLGKNTYLDVQKGKKAGNRPRIRQFGQEFVPEALLDVEIPKIGTGAPERGPKAPK